MLLQSHLGMIHLLPAIPDTWPTGSVSGLKARGNITIGMSWKNGVLQECSIQPAFSGEYVVRYRNSQVKLQLKAGKTYQLNQQLKVL
jgi:alpha-L-fucosidase 2